MAKFCIHCGKPLEEGEVCSCQQQPIENQVPISENVINNSNNNSNNNINNNVNNNNTNYNQQPMQNQFQQNTQHKSISYLKKIFNIFRNVLKQPSSYMQEYTATGDYPSALGLIGSQAIISALFTLVCFSKFNSYIKSLSFGLNDLLGDSDVNIAKFSLGKAFIITVIISFALSCALAGILYVIVKLFKGNTTYNHMLCATSARSIAVIPTSLLAIVVFYINPGYGIGLFYIGNLLGICFLINAMKTSLSIDQNKTPYVIFISILIFMIVSLFFMKTGAKMLIPEQYNTAWSQLFNIFKNPTDLIGDLW